MGSSLAKDSIAVDECIVRNHINLDRLLLRVEEALSKEEQLQPQECLLRHCLNQLLEHHLDRLLTFQSLAAYRTCKCLLLLLVSTATEDRAISIACKALSSSLIIAAGLLIHPPPALLRQF